MEAIFAKLLAALSAEEVLCVPGFIQSRYTFIQNGTITIGTARAEEVVVVLFAIGEAIAFEEVACAQFLVAVVAREMLRMPGLAQSSNDLAHNGFLTGVAAALLYSINTLTIHIRL